MFTGIKDTDREILRYVEDHELLKTCSVNKRMWNSVCDDPYLKRRLMKYPNIEKFKTRRWESWKSFFSEVIYYVKKMKRDFEFEYSGGDFRKQYEILNRSKNRGYNDLFFRAGEKNELTLVIFALKKGAEPHLFDDEILCNSCQLGRLEIVQYLIEKVGGYNINDALRWASLTGQLEVVKYLVSKEANVHMYDEISLRWASEGGHLETVKYLVERGANIHANNDYSLIGAAKNGHLSVVKYLVEKGANLHTNNDAAIQNAIRNERHDIVKYLTSL